MNEIIKAQMEEAAATASSTMILDELIKTEVTPNNSVSLAVTFLGYELSRRKAIMDRERLENGAASDFYKFNESKTEKIYEAFHDMALGIYGKAKIILLKTAKSADNASTTTGMKGYSEISFKLRQIVRNLHSYTRRNP